MRALRTLLIVVVVLGGLFVAADRFAVGYAEDKAAEKVRTSQGLDATPTVSIKGFPFLTQVAGRSLDQVDAELGNLQARADGRTLRIGKLTATFRDVELGSDYTTLKSVAQATGTAHISYQDLTKAAGANVRVTYSGEKNGRSQVTISPNLPLLSSLKVTGSISTVGGHTIRLRADEIPALCSALPGCADKVRTQTDHEWKLDRLPNNLRLDKVATTPDGITITASGKNVTL